MNRKKEEPVVSKGATTAVRTQTDTEETDSEPARANGDVVRIIQEKTVRNPKMKAAKIIFLDAVTYLGPDSLAGQ